MQTEYLPPRGYEITGRQGSVRDGISVETCLVRALNRAEEMEFHYWLCLFLAMSCLVPSLPQASACPSKVSSDAKILCQAGGTEGKSKIQKDSALRQGKLGGVGRPAEPRAVVGGGRWWRAWTWGPCSHPPETPHPHAHSVPNTGLTTLLKLPSPWFPRTQV